MDHIIPFGTFDGSYHLGHLMDHIIPLSNSPGQPLGHLMDHINPI